MTVIYIPRFDEDAAGFVLVDPDDYLRIGSGDLRPGESLKATQVVREGRRRLREVNLPYLGPRILVADGLAYRVLDPLVRNDGFWVQILVDGNPEARFFGFICAREVDGLADESEVSRFSSGGIMNIRRLALKSEAVTGMNAFSLSEWPRGKLYFSRAVADAAMAADLTGVTWLIAWSDEPEHPAPMLPSIL